jgi:hypothetical protein
MTENDQDYLEKTLSKLPELLRKSFSKKIFAILRFDKVL